MTQPPKPPAAPGKAARQERLEEQLRANLKRRKEAARARGAGPTSEAAPEAAVPPERHSK